MTVPDQPRIVWATDEQRAVDRQVAGRIMLGSQVLLTFACRAGASRKALDTIPEVTSRH